MKAQTNRAVSDTGVERDAWRVAAVLLLVCGVAWLPRTELGWHAAACVAVVAVLAALRVPPVRLAKSLAAVLPVSAAMAVFALFGEGGGRLFAVLMLKGVLCLSLVCGLMQRVGISELLMLLRRARLPGVLLTTLALLERYRFVLQDEMRRLLLARRCRLLVSERPGWRPRAAVLGKLFVRSTARAERVYRAMQARGWRT